ncbi:hypothetical protein [Microlunatus speluncae]|uniref:sunset domain-containing protein n=1 Tax=Microlunatus speluncae TaxID=2594267 RepID=UPI001266518B|nr:hypothetical protein [Microlunatus speluncae]
MTPLAQTAFDRVGPYVEQAVERVGPYATEAKKRGAKAAHDAVERLGPRLDDALERVSPAVEAARVRMHDDLLPKLTEALNAAAGSPVAIEAEKRGRAVIEAAKGELEPKKQKKKGRWIKRIAIVAVVAGVAAVVVKKLLGSSDQGWQAARPSAPYAPTPPTPSSPWSERADHHHANGVATPAAATEPADSTDPAAGIADEAPTEELTAVTDEPSAEVPVTDSTTPVAAVEGEAVAADLTEDPNGAAVNGTSVADEPAAPAAEESPADAALRAKYNGEGVYVGSEPPTGYIIKGNERSMKYHLPEAAGYNRTIAEVWFNSEEAAQAAGFVRAQR